MRSLVPVLIALACPIGMCLIPMLLMRRRGQAASCMQHGADEEKGEAQRLRSEVATLRDELARAQREDARG